MIEIDIGSNLASLGAFAISWHGFFSFVAVAVAIYLVGRWAPMRGVRSDAIYAIAIWAVVGGIIGARVVHVVDQWSFYEGSPGRMISVWNGGIGLWGGILGGFAGGVASTIVMNFVRANRRPRLESEIRRLEREGQQDDEDRKRLNELKEELDKNQHLPIGAIADMTAPAMLFVQTIGRLGDIVNGEHCAKAADFPLAFKWTSPLSDAWQCRYGTDAAVQPVIAYEMIWNMMALAVIWRLRDRLRPDGMLFALYLVLYSIGRFAITFAREDKVWIAGLQEAHFIALATLAVTVPLLAVKARLAPAGQGATPTEAAPQHRLPRAERRRRSRRR